MEEKKTWEKSDIAAFREWLKQPVSEKSFEHVYAKLARALLAVRDRGADITDIEFEGQDVQLPLFELDMRAVEVNKRLQKLARESALPVRA